MELGRTFHAKTRRQWRAWLQRNHNRERDIWLLFFTKASGKKGISYEDALNEALAFGWIDSSVKKVDADTRAQRFTPRRPGSPVSVANKVRIRRLVQEGRMTPAGLAASGGWEERDEIPADILAALQADAETSRNWQAFPDYYRDVRIGFVEGARKRPEEFRRRLNNLLLKTKQNKRFGRIQ